MCNLLVIIAVNSNSILPILTIACLTKAKVSTLEASHRKLQTSMSQIEFHNGTVFGYRNVEQVRLKTIQKTLVQVGPAIWLKAGETLRWMGCIYSVTGCACSVKRMREITTVMVPQQLAAYNNLECGDDIAVNTAISLMASIASGRITVK